MKKTAVLFLCVLVAGCATQRFGRLSPLSETEKQQLNCREIAIEIAKAEEFLFQTRRTRNDTNSAHVLGFLGDFGIGNVMEGDAAELSGNIRLKELKDLSVRKSC
ncbi:MAG: hypothetical protein JNL71_17485 [Rhodospirillales bacterium]|nr:hypothetical protein [Rhodospirillales bacterium]